jgi:hypothetical protein
MFCDSDYGTVPASVGCKQADSRACTNAFNAYTNSTCPTKAKGGEAQKKSCTFTRRLFGGF